MNTQMQKPEKFIFTHRSFDAVTGTLTLGYSYPGVCDFAETIIFGPSKHKLSSDDQTALENSFRALHMAAGISYYKAYIPQQIEINDGALDDASADFFENLYFNGLGEFAFRNQVKLKNKIKFPRGGKTPTAVNITPSNKTLVPVGGGKDSLVTVEALRRAKQNITLCAVNRAGPIVSCINNSDLDAMFFERKIDKQLLKLNEQGALNGHVPITAIVSLILVAAAIWNGYDGVAFSNERSANEGNTEWEGRTVNHQFSKSLEFENALSGFIKNRIASGIDCFSFLRPLSELHIAKLFSTENRYDDVFTSCNKSYRINDAMVDKRWCCDCPKCRFVFLVLAPFMDKERLVNIFSHDMLDDASQIDGFRELLGLKGHKPWECVGEILESGAAFNAIATKPEWADTTIIKALSAEMAAGADELNKAFVAMLTPDNTKNIPPRFKGAFDETIG
ncbi:MAG: hypothetical protein OEW37_05580 [Rhodospirillaceae bacterium]|nr:hypothetical protein [Rhodospirillaceae bacterium]